MPVAATPSSPASPTRARTRARLIQVAAQLAEALIAVMPARAWVGARRLRRLAYGLGNDARMARGHEIAAGRYAAAVQWWRERFPDEARLPIPAEHLVRVINALTEGLTPRYSSVPCTSCKREVTSPCASSISSITLPLGS
jgi:hypothetical protein